MTEKEVLKYLNRKKKFTNAKEIAKNINLSISSVNKSLRELFLQKKVNYKLVKEQYIKTRYWRKLQ